MPAQPATSSMPATRSRRTALALLAGLCLSGCGFALRGQTQLPFKTFWSALPKSSLLGGELRRAIRTQGATVVELREEAQLRFELLLEQPEREISALSTSGRPREYQLRYRVRWRARDAREQELVAVTELVLRRAITVLDVQGILNEDEVQLLYRDMRIDAIQQILRRLSVLPVQPPITP